RIGGYSLYRWEVTMREVVVVGLVAAGGLGRLLQEQLSAFDYRGVVATLMTLICLTILADVVGASIRRAIR
ncbi:MAG: phosphate ABC transporter permease, partial [Actinomycetota bacterium]